MSIRDAIDTTADTPRTEFDSGHVREGGANTPYFILRILAKTPSRRIAGTISAIRVTMV